MTIEEIPESTRCPDCGTWLPRAALECPSCGRPRDLALTGPPRRGPPSRRLLIGGGAGSVLILGVIIFWALMPPAGPLPSPSQQLGSGVAVASPSRLPSRAPTSSPVPTLTTPPSRSPTPRPTPAPQVRAPLFLPLEIPDTGRRATVIAPGPPIRDALDTATSQIVLGAGSELLLRDGPVAVDGYDWYWAYFPPRNGGLPETGWVAAGPSGKAPTLIEIGPVQCLAVPVTVALIGSMTDLARRECLGAGSHEVNGLLLGCYDGPVEFWGYQPFWLHMSCDYIVELGTSVSVVLQYPPSFLLPATVRRGDTVRLVGHVNDPVSADCRVLPGEDTTFASPGFTSEEEKQRLQQILQQLFVLHCRSGFVVTEIETTGHVAGYDF